MDGERGRGGGEGGGGLRSSSLPLYQTLIVHNNTRIVIQITHDWGSRTGNIACSLTEERKRKKYM